MNRKALFGASKGVFVAMGAALVLAACYQPPAYHPPAAWNFDSAADTDLSITIEQPPDPNIDIAVPIPGHATGTWAGSGALDAALTFDDGVMTIDFNGSPILVGYEMDATSDATGTFSRTTGTGTLSAALALTVTSVDLGDGPSPIGQPCVVGMAATNLAGAVDLGTNVLSVHQDGFAVTPPAAEDCDFLGEAIGTLLGGPINSIDLSFSVAGV